MCPKKKLREGGVELNIELNEGLNLNPSLQEEFKFKQVHAVDKFQPE
jgi:hypothetical protein